MLHIFTAEIDPETSKKALFKAYDLNPADLAVMNCLLSYYLRTRQQTKFYHTLQMANKLNHQNPHVLSLLFLLNGFLGVQTQFSDKLKPEIQEIGGVFEFKQKHLLEAINLA